MKRGRAELPTESRRSGFLPDGFPTGGTAIVVLSSGILSVLRLGVFLREEIEKLM
jgi:hypothetical protein